jgi:hypothetical protein
MASHTEARDVLSERRMRGEKVYVIGEGPLAGLPKRREVDTCPCDAFWLGPVLAMHVLG